MSEQDAPVLMLIALHLRSMAAMPGMFWRVRELARALERQDGALKAHRWLSRRSLLLSSWWRDRKAAEEWLGQRKLRDVARRAEEMRAGFWVELYSLEAAPVRQAGRGAPWAPPG